MDERDRFEAGMTVRRAAATSLAENYVGLPMEF
jgi:hypothetical protein